MLLELRIHDLGLVEDLVLPVSRGLTVLTGETGAGKSMLAGAIAALGGREVDKGLVRTGAGEARVEGVFDLSDRPDIAGAVARTGAPLAEDGLLVVRREIRREGRNRVLLNGLTTSLAVLRQIGPLLVSVQSQDQQRELERPGFFRDLLDELGDALPLRREVADAWQRWRESEQELAAAREELALARQQLDLWRYQYEELSGAALDPGEEGRLRERIALKRDAVNVAETLAAVWDRLGGEEAAVSGLVGGAADLLERIAAQSPRLQAIAGLLRDAEARLQEAVLELDRLRESWDADPTGLDELEERLALYQELQRKYRRDTTQLLALTEELARKLERYRDSDAELARLEREREEAATVLCEAALRLRRRRQEASGRVAARLQETLRPLALPHLELRFEVTPEEATGNEGLVVGDVACRIARHGADRVDLLVGMNPGEAPGPAGRIASGGERSRLLLGITAERTERVAPVLQLFDEIDAGVGMDTAPAIGELLRRLAGDGQVICITHLATLAVRGDRHWCARKTTRRGRTVLRIVPVDGEERVREVARLLGGEEGGDATLAHARRLLAGRTRVAAGDGNGS